MISNQARWCRVMVPVVLEAVMGRDQGTARWLVKETEIGRRWSPVPAAPEESTLERVQVPARGRAQASEAFPAVLERATEWGFKVVFPVREWRRVPVVRRVVESPGPDWVVGPDLAKRECLACPGRSAPADLELELPADWETDPAMGIFPARYLPV